MKAAVFYGKGDIRVEEREVRGPGPGEIVLRVACCGVCGTDVHIYHGDKGAADTVPPKVLGHEFSGTVTQVGPGIAALRAGDRVAVDPNFYCGQCHYCRSGAEHLCAHMNGIGTTLDGGFAEYCTLPAAAALKVPDDMPLETAAFAEPLACCLHGIDLTGIRPGDHVLLIGGGTIGLLMLQLARLAGAGWLALVEPEAAKRGLAQKLGADAAFESAGAWRGFMDAHPDIRADRVIECVGKPETVRFALDAAGRGATVMLFGLTAPDDEVPVKPFEIFQKELHVTASFVNPYTTARAVDILARGRVQVQPLVAARRGLQELAGVLEDSSSRRAGKVLIVPGAAGSGAPEGRE